MDTRQNKDEDVTMQGNDGGREGIESREMKDQLLIYDEDNIKAWIQSDEVIEMEDSYNDTED